MLTDILQENGADDALPMDMKRIRLDVPTHRIELIGENYGHSDFDDLRIYSVPLSKAEITELYQR